MSRRTPSEQTYLAPSDVAGMLMVSPATIRHWASKGDLDAVTTAGGHRRFLLHDIEKFAHERNLTMLIPGDDVVRILIVDDDVLVADYLYRLIERSNSEAECRIAHNGYDAGSLVQSFKPHFVLLDLMMPEMNGFDVCRKIKSDTATKATRVIAMTGFYNEDNVRQALDAGAERCIQKPFDQRQLLELLGLEDITRSPRAIR